MPRTVDGGGGVVGAAVSLASLDVDGTGFGGEDLVVEGLKIMERPRMQRPEAWKVMNHGRLIGILAISMVGGLCLGFVWV